jgi:hypothetical protein
MLISGADLTVATGMTSCPGTELPLPSLLFRLWQKTTLLLMRLRRTRVLFRALLFSFFLVRRKLLY